MLTPTRKYARTHSCHGISSDPAMGRMMDAAANKHPMTVMPMTGYAIHLLHLLIFPTLQPSSPHSRLIILMATPYGLREWCVSPHRKEKPLTCDGMLTKIRQFGSASSQRSPIGSALRRPLAVKLHNPLRVSSSNPSSTSRRRACLTSQCQSGSPFERDALRCSAVSLKSSAIGPYKCRGSIGRERAFK